MEFFKGHHGGSQTLSFHMEKCVLYSTYTIFCTNHQKSLCISSLLMHKHFPLRGMALAVLSSEKKISSRPNSLTLSRIEGILMLLMILPGETSIASTIDCVPKISSITLVRYVEEEMSSEVPFRKLRKYSLADAG